MEWTIDQAHSSIEFAVRHMGIATVRGTFGTFEATPALNEDGVLTGVTATIDVASLDTGVQQRDDHLRSPDFFDVAQFPKMEYRSMKVQSLGARHYRVNGDLTMKGVTHPVTLDVEVSEPVQDPWGNQRIGAEISGKLNRTTWGLKWNQVLEAGSLLVGEDVKISMEMQVVAQAPAGV
jgi:polyisoprenoid-binding protein YceI